MSCRVMSERTSSVTITNSEYSAYVTETNQKVLQSNDRTQIGRTFTALAPHPQDFRLSRCLFDVRFHCQLYSICRRAH